MLKRSLSLATAALLAALAPAALRAQTGARPVFDQVTVGGGFGGLSGAADADQAGANSWRLGWAASLDAPGWINDYVGIPATGGWAQDSLDGYGFGKTQHDIAWQGGVTLSF